MGPTMNESQTHLDTLLELLSRWRHLPSYQLERRADLLFSLYLPQVLGAELKLDMDPRLLPEFPLKQPDSALSDKVDYMAVTSDLSRAVLVELKTDMGSLRPNQNAYLVAAKKRGMSALLEDLRVIVHAQTKKQHRKKYFHLLTELAAIGLLTLPKELETCIYARNSRGLAKLIDQIVITQALPTLELVYVLPNRPGEMLENTYYLNFERFAEVIESTHNDHLSRGFARSLRTWAEHPAGDPAPSQIGRVVATP